MEDLKMSLKHVARMQKLSSAETRAQRCNVVVDLREPAKTLTPATLLHIFRKSPQLLVSLLRSDRGLLVDMLADYDKELLMLDKGLLVLDRGFQRKVPRQRTGPIKTPTRKIANLS